MLLSKRFLVAKNAHTMLINGFVSGKLFTHDADRGFFHMFFGLDLYVLDSFVFFDDFTYIIVLLFCIVLHLQV